MYSIFKAKYNTTLQRLSKNVQVFVNVICVNGVNMFIISSHKFVFMKHNLSSGDDIVKPGTRQIISYEYNF